MIHRASLITLLSQCGLIATLPGAVENMSATLVKKLKCATIAWFIQTNKPVTAPHLLKFFPPPTKQLFNRALLFFFLFCKINVLFSKKILMHLT